MTRDEVLFQICTFDPNYIDLSDETMADFFEDGHEFEIVISTKAVE